MKGNPNEASALRPRKKRVFYGHRPQRPKGKGAGAAGSLLLLLTSLVCLLAFLFLVWNPLTPRDIVDWSGVPSELRQRQSSDDQSGSAARRRALRSQSRTAAVDFSLLRSDAGRFELSALLRLDREMLGIRTTAVLGEFSTAGPAFLDELMNEPVVSAKDFANALVRPEMLAWFGQSPGGIPPEDFDFGSLGRRAGGFTGGPIGGGMGFPAGFHPGRPVGEDPAEGVDQPDEGSIPPQSSGDTPQGVPVASVPEASAWVYLAWGSLFAATLARYRRSASVLGDGLLSAENSRR